MAKKDNQKNVSAMPFSPIQQEFERQFIDNIEISLPADQQAFVDAYYKLGRNYTKAYAQTHPNNKSSSKTMNETACRYVKHNPQIVAKIAQIDRFAAEKASIMLTATKALENISNIAMHCRDVAVKLRANQVFLEWITKKEENSNPSHSGTSKIVFLPYPKGKQAKKLDLLIEKVINNEQ